MTSLFWKEKKRRDEVAVSKSATCKREKKSGTNIQTENIIGIPRHPRLPDTMAILLYSSNNKTPCLMIINMQDIVFFFDIRRAILLDGYQFSSLPFS